MEKLAEQTLQLLRDKNYTVATAESCTGGSIIACLTDIAGSSDVVDRGFITYSNQAKIDMLGVPKDLLEQYGAVSEEVAIAMADGAQSRGGVDVAVSVTGIAGPDGGSEEKPVGLVHFAVNAPNNTYHAQHIFEGNRTEIRRKSVAIALNMIIKAIS
jgi:nicotinamide-nucleotide amidase